MMECWAARTLIRRTLCEDLIDYFEHIAADIAPHLCARLPRCESVALYERYCWDADCYQLAPDAGLSRRARCQKWFHFAAVNIQAHPPQSRNEVMREYERELYPELCLPGCINELTVSLLRQRHNCWDGS